MATVSGALLSPCGGSGGPGSISYMLPPCIHVRWASAAEEIRRVDELLAVPTEGHAFGPRRPSRLLEERDLHLGAKDAGCDDAGAWGQAAHHGQGRPPSRGPLQALLFLLLRMQPAPV